MRSLDYIFVKWRDRTRAYKPKRLIEYHRLFYRYVFSILLVKIRKQNAISEYIEGSFKVDTEFHKTQEKVRTTVPKFDVKRDIKEIVLNL